MGTHILKNKSKELQIVCKVNIKLYFLPFVLSDFFKQMYYVKQWNVGFQHILHCTDTKEQSEDKQEQMYIK